jgi:hypothetical protein
VISTAGDDASSGEARTYADAILALGHVTGVTIIHADAVARLGAFIDSFGARKMTPMNEYYMGAIDALAGLVYQQPPLTCLPITPTALSSCDVFTSHEHVVRALPSCDSAFDSMTPCYQLVDEPSCESGLLLLLGGPYGNYHPRIFGRCK